MSAVASEAGVHEQDRAQLAWTVGAGLRVGDHTYPEPASFYSRGDERVVISGDEGLEVFAVDFPRLD